jgi:N6-L-threonylcarbamoyladenine synthase
MSAVLGIDTSCYTTSCALIDAEGRVLADVRRLLQVPAGDNGLRQSEAVFSHIRQLPGVIAEAMDMGGHPGLFVLCASNRPMDDKDSYMPVFQAGVSHAAAIAAASGLPCFFTTHQRGHFAAAGIGRPPIGKTHLAIHLSGGTTELFLVQDTGFERIAGTGDITAGQLLDRIGVLLGFPFPAGAELEKLARQGKAEGRYPSAVKGSLLHLSGAEAAAKRDIERQSISNGQVAAELVDVISRSLVKLSMFSSQQTGIFEILVTGGVASSELLRESLLRRVLQRGLPLVFHFGDAKYASDNAAGVALIGLHQYQAYEEDSHGHCAQREGTV